MCKNKNAVDGSFCVAFLSLKLSQLWAVLILHFLSLFLSNVHVLVISLSFLTPNQPR